MIDVALGIANNRWLTGCATGGMNPDYLIHGDAKESKGIVLSQIVFYGKGKF